MSDVTYGRRHKTETEYDAEIVQLRTERDAALARVTILERENAALRIANEVLKATAAMLGRQVEAVERYCRIGLIGSDYPEDGFDRGVVHVCKAMSQAMKDAANAE